MTTKNVTIPLKRSAVPGKVPATTDLSLGEVAINTYDGAMYIKKNNGSDAIVLINDETPHVAVVTFSATPTINWAEVDVARITMTGNITTTTMTGALDGQKMILELIQDSTGGRTISFGSNVRFGTDLTSITLSTAANKMDRVGLIYNSAASKYDVIAFVKGF